MIYHSSQQTISAILGLIIHVACVVFDGPRLLSGIGSAMVGMSLISEIWHSRKKSKTLFWSGLFFAVVIFAALYCAHTILPDKPLTSNITTKELLFALTMTIYTIQIWVMHLIKRK